MPIIDLNDDELAALAAAIRRFIENDKLPHAPLSTRYAPRARKTRATAAPPA
jgi:hypothetical protein